jgi:hypothetical protein
VVAAVLANKSSSAKEATVEKPASPSRLDPSPTRGGIAEVLERGDDLSFDAITGAPVGSAPVGVAVCGTVEVKEHGTAVSSVHRPTSSTEE